jgi:hypothetical protein
MVAKNAAQDLVEHAGCPPAVRDAGPTFVYVSELDIGQCGSVVEQPDRADPESALSESLAPETEVAGWPNQSTGAMGETPLGTGHLSPKRWAPSMRMVSPFT